MKFITYFVFMLVYVSVSRRTHSSLFHSLVYHIVFSNRILFSIHSPLIRHISTFDILALNQYLNFECRIEKICFKSI